MRAMRIEKTDTEGIIPHYFHVGGATAHANPPGGDLVAGYMGLWRSNAGDGYLHAGKRRLEKASLVVGLEASD